MQKPTQSSASKANQQGFTLMELMVVVAIIGIMAAFAAPSFQQLIVSNDVKAATNDLASDLNFARSEALKRGVSVTACLTSDFSTCANTEQWQTGWIIFIDRNSNNARSTTATDNEDLLRVRQEVNGAFVIQSTGGTAVKTIRFDRTGSSAAVGLKISPHNTSVQAGRAVCIATTGRIRTTAAGTEAC